MLSRKLLALFLASAALASAQDTPSPVAMEVPSVQEIPAPVAGTPAPITEAPVSDSPISPAPVSTTASPVATTPAPVTPAPVATTPAPLTPSPVEATAAPVAQSTPAPATPAPVTPAPVTPGTPAPVTPGTPAPVTPAPVANTPAPVTPAPVTFGTPAPVTVGTPAPVTPAPVTVSTPAPFISAPVRTLAPVTLAPGTVPPTDTPLPPELLAKSDFRCGKDEADARSNCKTECPDGDSTKCAEGEYCWATFPSYCHIMPAPHPYCDSINAENVARRCGYDEYAARGYCGIECESVADCGVAEDCFPVQLNLCTCFEEQDAQNFTPNTTRRTQEVWYTSNAEYFLEAKKTIDPYFLSAQGTGSPAGSPTTASTGFAASKAGVLAAVIFGAAFIVM